MMTIKTQLYWLLCLTLAACIAKPANIANTPLPNAPTKYATSEGFATVLMPTTSVIPTLTQPELPNVTWSTYRFDVGVEFEYPGEWIPVSKDTDWILFSMDQDSVRVKVSHSTIGNSVLMNPPDTWGTNEGGYGVLWEKPISIENAEGLEFLWGQSSDNPLAGHRFLYAIYYSKEYELQVTFSLESAMISIGSDKFNVFERMVQSVQIGR